MTTPPNVATSIDELLSNDDDENFLQKLPAVLKIVEDAGRLAKMSGADKKKLVIDTLCNHVRRRDESDKSASKVITLEFIEHILPHLIDAFIDVDNGTVKISMSPSCGCFRRR
jgi:hypothetical protein